MQVMARICEVGRGQLGVHIDVSHTAGRRRD